MKKIIYPIIALFLICINYGHGISLSNYCVASETIATDSMFSELCNVTRLSDGTYDVKIPADIEDINQHQISEENVTEISFYFLCFVFEKTFQNRYDEQMVVNFLQEAFKAAPFNIAARNYFYIKGIRITKENIVLPLRKFQGKALNFILNKNKTDLVKDKKGVSNIRFNIIQTDNISSGIDAYSSEKEIIDSMFTTGENIKADKEYETFIKERAVFSNQIIGKLIHAGGRLCYFFVNIFNGLDEPIVIGENKKIDENKFAEGTINVPIIRFDSGTKKNQSGSYKKSFERLFGPLKRIQTVGSRVVFAGENVIIKTMHYDGYYPLETQVRALSGEYVFQKKMIGGIPFPWPVVMITLDGEKVWLVEQKGNKVSLDDAINKGDMNKMADVVRKIGMFTRFFHDEGLFPDQMDCLFDNDTERIFMCDAYPHGFRSELNAKENTLMVLKKSIRREKQEEFSGRIERWFNEGFNHPKQFSQYQMMIKARQIENKEKINRFLISVKDEINGKFSEFFSLSLWGVLEDFLRNHIGPIAAGQVKLEKMVKIFSIPAKSKSIVLFVEALEEVLPKDLEVSLKKSKRILRKGNIVLYVNGENQKNKAEKYSHIIKKVLPDTNILIVKKEDLQSIKENSTSNAFFEVNEIMKYVTRKDFDSDGVVEISKKDTLGILRVSDEMNLLKEMKDYRLKIPCIIMNRQKGGIFSFSQALASMMETYLDRSVSLKTAKMWIKILSPVKIITGEMIQEYNRYREYILNMA